jgi:hypothetical protein
MNIIYSLYKSNRYEEDEDKLFGWMSPLEYVGLSVSQQCKYVTI